MKVAECVFWGKRFKSQESMDYYKRTVFPKILKAIDKEYYKQRISQETGLSLQAWRHLNLCNFRTANLHGGRWRAGMPAWFKDVNWGCPDFNDFHS